MMKTSMPAGCSSSVFSAILHVISEEKRQGIPERMEFSFSLKGWASPPLTQFVFQPIIPASTRAHALKR